MWKIILSTILAVQLSAEVVNLNKFDEGLGTRLAPILLPNGGTPDCQNVLFDEVGGIIRRNGYKYKGYANVDTVGQRLFPYKKSSGAKYLYKQINASLYKTISGDDNSWTEVRSDIKWEQNFLDSAIIENLLFITNGIDNVFSVDGGSSYTEYPFIKRGKYITSKSEGTSGVLYDRVFVANTYDFASGVYYSDITCSATDSNAWSELQIFLVGGNDGEVITALYVWRGSLYIFKEHSVWRLSGNQPSNWVLRRLTREYGCFGQDTIQEKDNILIFVSKDRKAVVGFDGNFFTELSKPIEPDLENWDNFEGYYNYWIQSTDDDFIAGTSTGNEVGDDIVLEDLTKVWNSSATYPFSFSSGTFSDTEISGEYVTLKSTHSYTDISEDVSLVNILERTYNSISGWGEIQDIEYNNSHRIYDDDFATVSTSEEPTTSYFGSSKYYSYDNINESKLWFDFEESTNTIAKIRYKARFKAGIIFYTQNLINDYDTYSFRIRVTVFYNSGSGWQSVGYKAYNKTFQGSQFYIFSTSGFYGYRLKNEYDLVASDEVDTVTLSSPIPESSAIRTEVSIFTDEFIMPNVSEQALCYINYPDIYEIEFYKDGGSSNIKTYYSSGTYKTEIHDITEGDGLAYLSTATYIVSGSDPRNVESSSITFRVAASSWSATLSGATWYDSQNGNKLNSNLSPCRYVQVLSSFTTDYSSHTAILQSMSIGATRSTSSFKTANFQVDEITGWKYFIADHTIPDDTGISYAIRTSSSETGLDSATWDWIESGDLIDSGLHTSTHTWIVAKATTSTTDGTRRPEIHSLTFTWYPESEPIRLTSKIVDKRYWLGVSTYTGYNDNIYVLDKNMKWTRFSGYTPADITNWKGKTYVLDASSSAIWQADYGNADRWESATSSYNITSYWTSKALFLALDRESSIEYIYSSLKATGGDLTVGYAMYGDDYSEFTVDLDGSGEINDRTRITSGETWKVWQFKLSDTSTVDSWEMHNVGVYFVPKPLR